MSVILAGGFLPEFDGQERLEEKQDQRTELEATPVLSSLLRTESPSLQTPNTMSVAPNLPWSSL